MPTRLMSTFVDNNKNLLKNTEFVTKGLFSRIQDRATMPSASVKQEIFRNRGNQVWHQTKRLSKNY